MGAEVYAGCLSPEGDGAAKLRMRDMDNLHVLQLDVTDQDHIDLCLQRIKQDAGDIGMLSLLIFLPTAIC